MKAAVQTGLADAEKHPHGDASVIKVIDIDKPSDPASDQVLLRVHAASLNPVDLLRTAQSPENEVQNPVIGYDVAGVVEAVGAEVSKFSVGDRVFGNIMLNSMGPKEVGSFAEYTLAPAATLARIPSRVSFTDAAAVPVAALTGLQTLRKAGAKCGQSLFHTAGSGGVALHSMQIAKAYFDMSEIAVTASRTSEHLVKKYGADLVIDYHTQDAAQVLPKWADVVIDATGELEMQKKVVKDGGKLMSIVVMNDDAFEGVICEPSAEDIAIVADLMEKGQLIPVIDSVYSFDDVEKALEKGMSGRAKGKIVVKMLDD